MNKRAIVVYNPAMPVEPWLSRLAHELCEEEGYLLSLFATGPQRAVDDLGAILARGLDLVIAAGGDGTVRFVLAALVRSKSNVPMAIVPAGTLNVLARTLGVLDESFFASSLDGAMKTIRHGKTMRMDLGIMNGTYFGVTAAAGPMSDAFVVTKRCEKIQWRHLAYARHMLRTIVEPPLMFKITADDDKFFVAASGVFIGNVEDLGLCRRSDVGGLVDGLLVMVVLNPRGFPDYVKVGFRFAGGFDQVDAPMYVRKVTSATVEVMPANRHRPALRAFQRFLLRLLGIKHPLIPPDYGQVKAMVDGEECGATPMHVKVVPDAVTVLVPADCPVPERGDGKIAGVESGARRERSSRT